MLRGKKVLIGVLAAVILCAAVVGVFLWYRSPRPIPVPGEDGVISAHIMVVDGQRDESWSPELTPEQAKQIVECLGGYTMSRGGEKKYAMHIDEPYYYVSLWLRGEDGETYRVNAANREEHSTVQFGEQHHDIFNSPALLAQLREILKF